MASGDPRDPQYGQPYTGSPRLQGSRDGVSSTVLDLNALGLRRITEHVGDDHYTADGHLYHE